MDVTGSALVTGASRGIGRAIATELASRGFNTVATMRNPADGVQLAAESGGRVTVQALNVTDPGTIDLPGDLRVLVNNAGIDTGYLPVEHSNLGQWRALFETNVFGLVGVTMAAIPVLRDNWPAVICNITSSSILASMPFYAAYRASKAAVSALGDSLRVEVAPFGIRVVEILPGPVDTDMFQRSATGLSASQFEKYGSLAGVTDAMRQEHADPLVVAPTVAAAAIVDAILDDSGPLRYGCDPLSTGLLDLWRQSDDEAMFALTGQPLVEQADLGGYPKV
jgi:NAD(P)-dependent dehydrogenase (short-subunit alcohol dehydrogenase family)